MNSGSTNDKNRRAMILVVDDDPLIHAKFELDFRTKVSIWDVLYVKNLKEAFEQLSTNKFHVAIVDKDLGRPGTSTYESGIKAVPEFISIQPQLQILAFTGSKDIKDCVEAMRLGARDYITKETDRSLLFAQIEKAIEQAETLIHKTRLERGINSDATFNLVGRSNAIRSLRTRLQMVSTSSRPVILTGETGTGKTTAAKLIHEYRKNKNGKTNSPFVQLNMASIPSTLAERELFGNEKGAYTGASESKAGYFELAHGGTLFLDEIGEASLDLQAKLLKILDDGKFYRLGGTRELKSSFNLICATNRNLEKMIDEKTFREDLYMRIATLQVRMPSLKERKVDIPDIVKSLLSKVCEENNAYIKYKDLPKDFIEFLENNPSSGNIRGIEQLLCQLLVFSPKDSEGIPQTQNWKSTLGIGPVTVLPDGSPAPISLEELRARSIDILAPGFPGLHHLEAEISSMVIEKALKQCPSFNSAARALKISKGSLKYRQNFSLSQSNKKNPMTEGKINE